MTRPEQKDLLGPLYSQDFYPEEVWVQFQKPTELHVAEKQVFFIGQEPVTFYILKDGTRAFSGRAGHAMGPHPDRLKFRSYWFCKPKTGTPFYSGSIFEAMSVCYKERGG